MTGSQASAQSVKTEPVESIHTAVENLRRETCDLHDPFDDRAAVGKVEALFQETRYL